MKGPFFPVLVTFLLLLSAVVQEGQGIKCYKKEKRENAPNMVVNCPPCHDGRFPGCVKYLHPLGRASWVTSKDCICLRDNEVECHTWGGEEHCYCNKDLCNNKHLRLGKDGKVITGGASKVMVKVKVNALVILIVAFLF